MTVADGEDRVEQQHAVFGVWWRSEEAAPEASRVAAGEIYSLPGGRVHEGSGQKSGYHEIIHGSRSFRLSIFLIQKSIGFS